MKKYLFSLIFILLSYVGFAQKSLSYQAVILDPNPIEAPGVDINGQPFVNGEVWVRFSIYGSSLQFEEVHKTKTDAYGLVNLMIGSVSAASFNSLVWDSAQKTLQVHVSFDQGGTYTKVSDQKLTYNPYSLYAETASKLGGTLAITGGGTGATTLSAARVNLGIDKVDNTPDAAKPISAAVQAALDLKANKGDVPAATATITDADANTKGKIQLAGDLGGTAAAPTVPALALKANSSDVTTGLALKANASDVTTALSAKADTAYVLTKVAAATIADADATTKGKIQLAGDLGGTAAAPTVPALALKANSSDVTTALALKANSSDVTTGLALKANSSDVTTALAAKANASDVSNSLTLKANASDMTTSLNLKANTSDMTSALASKASASDLSTGLALKINASEKGAANGIATLNSSGIIPSSQLPPVTLSSTNVVASDADMTALSSATVGSIAIRTDLNKNYVLSALPASTLGNWVELLTPAAPVQTVNGYTGAINLSKADINLGDVDNTSDATKPVSTATQAALDLKLDANKVGVATGVASLNALGKIPTDQIPAISFSSVKVLGSEAAMLSLNSAVIGSVVIRTDVNKNYVLAQANPSVLANWIELLTPAPPVQTVNGYSGSVSLTKSDIGLANAENTSDASKPVSTATLNALNLKAPLASPTFTGTVTTGAISATSITAPTYASAPKTLSYTGSTINWNPAQGLNAAITLTQNSALNFTAAPPVGSYGTVVLTQDGTGSRTISLPVISGATNKVLGSTSTSTVALSTAANSKDILNFYYDGTNCYWNIGQGYGTAAATAASTNLATSVTGTLAVANGGTGATTLTGLVKGTGTTAFTAAVAGTDYLAPNGSAANLTNFPTFNQNTTGNAATVTTNANLNGDVTSVGNTATVVKINGTSLASLSTGILKNTTSTGVPTIAVAGTDYLAPNGSAASLTNFPTLNQNTTGNAATVTTNANLNGDVTSVGNTATVVKINGTSLASLSTGILKNTTTTGVPTIAVAGTDYQAPLTLTTSGTGAATLSGTTLNIPSVSSTVNAGSISGTVAVANGGTGATTLTANNVLLGNGTSALQVVAPGASGNVLTSNGTTWSSSAPAASGVPYSNATGPVNLGAYNLTVNSLTIGQGGRSSNNNTAIGIGVLPSTTSGSNNTGLGSNALAANTGDNNVGIGFQALKLNTSGGNNIAIGQNAANSNLTGSNNVAIGFQTAFWATSDNITAVGSMALNAEKGAGNTAIGVAAGKVGSGGPYINTTNSTFLGYNTTTGKTTDVTITNATAIGYGATVAASNTIQLGNTSVTDIKTSGALTTGAVTYPITHAGTSGQVLTSLGSGTLSWTTPAGGGGSSTHTIGESYGGGIVFYTWDGGAHGLIGANTELNSGQAVAWGGGSGAYVGTPNFYGVLGGKINTQRILNVIPVPTYGGGDPQTGQRCAAYWAAIYMNAAVVVNGVTTTPQFSDWYLPNATELMLFATQSAYFPNCNFATHDHWTSCERTDYAYLAFALAANSNSYIYQDNKSSTKYVVAIRSF